MGRRGGTYESDTMGYEAHDERLLKLISMITEKIYSRRSRTRNLGARWTILETFCEWAVACGIPAQNVVKRWQGGRLTCQLPRGKEVFLVKHVCSWGTLICPKSWLKLPTFTAGQYTPPPVEGEQARQRKRKAVVVQADYFFSAYIFL